MEKTMASAIYWLEKANESRVKNGPDHEITKEYINNLYGAAVYIDKNDYTESTNDYDR